jgi:glycerophosphoryl diester phosphodiesterase
LPPGATALQIPPRFGDIELVTAETLAAAHRLGAEVHVWTINEPDEMRRLLALGCDGIMSDFPGRARAVVDEESSHA